MNAQIAFAILAVLSLACPGDDIYAPHENPTPPSASPELVWSKWLARELNAESEHVLFSGKRVDVLMHNRAIEVEWCVQSKINEAVDQASYYSMATGRPGAIVLLVGRGEYPTERMVYDAAVSAAREKRLGAVAVLDLREPNVGKCCEQLGLVPTPCR